MPDEHSRIEYIVDYTCVVAASIDGVDAVAGAGLNHYDDPLRPGTMIETYGDKPKIPNTHVSELPSAPAVRWITQEGIVELTWIIPMRFFLDGNDPFTTRRQSLPMYDRYLRAFVRDHTLGGLVLRSQLTSFAMGESKEWAWLDVRLTVVEEINYTAG